MAVQDGFGDKKKTFFFDCVASGKTGENIAKYFEKGKPILVEGKLIGQKDLDSALKTQREKGGALSKILVAQGAISEQELMLALGKQLGIPPLNLFKVKIDIPDRTLTFKLKK